MITIFLFLSSFSNAENIDISHVSDLSLLEHSKVYFTDENETLSTLGNKLKPYSKTHINIGTSTKTIWISFVLSNSSSHTINKILVLDSPLLENILLYDNNDTKNTRKRGMTYISEIHDTLSPYYAISLPSHSSKEYILKINSKTNPIYFSILLTNKDRFYKEDRQLQFIYTLLIGILVSMMIFSLLNYFYIRDVSYLFYAIYLFVLIYQQFGYIGLSQIYFSNTFILEDMHRSVFKVTLLMITSLVYGMYFLKVKEIKVLYTFYKIFITIAFLEMVILSLPQFYNLDIVVFTALINMAFNLTAGFISYMHGNKQARLYILGFSIVSMAYILMALSTLGIINAIHEFRYLLLALSTLEALILSLAFTDRYLLLQKDKEKSDALLLKNSKNRTKIIEKEVTVKTQELKSMVETQKLLIQEIHHRVKNNLQIILSMLRMQNDHIETELDKTQFQNLENRINAISKTYNMLIINEDLEEVNLSEYIDSLLSDIQSSYLNEELQVNIKTDISSILPLRVSIYIGLILNEMVTNSYKYAFHSHGTIEITLHKYKNEYILTYRDDGKGFLLGSKDGSLGLKLIDQLVYHQLNGSMEVDSYKHTKYTIRFVL